MPENTKQGQSNLQQTGKSVEQRANQATERAAQKAQSSFESARSKVTEQFTAVAHAIDSAASTLEQKQQSGLSRKVKQYVRKAENASEYLRDKSPQELKQDAENFAREKPAWFLGGAFLLGLLGARFLKSSEKQTANQFERGGSSVEYARA